MMLTNQLELIENKLNSNEPFQLDGITLFYDIKTIKPKTNANNDGKPKPFVKWVGGKRQLINQFRVNNLYPPRLFDMTKSTYFEPFVGGGAVFFDLLPKKSCLSDLNFELVTTYNIIKTDVQSLITHLKQHRLDKEYFLEIRSQNPLILTPVEVASRFIYLNRTCFNGMYRVNSKGGFNVPYGKYTNPLICDESNLLNVAKVLQDVKINHGDYKGVLDEAQKGDFLYFDPPYFPVSKTSSFTSYTKEGFLEKEQIELKNTLLELHSRGCYVMLSNSDTPFIFDLYSQHEAFHVHKVQASRAINSDATKRGKVSEILVTNY